MVGMGDVAAAAHQLESLFGQMQRREVDPDPQAIDEVYRALDALSAMIGASVGQRGMAGPAPRPSGPVSAPVSPQPGPESAPVSAQSAPATAQTPGADAQAMPDAMPAGRSGESTVRVSTAKLDSLMAHLGQLTVARMNTDEEQRWMGKFGIMAIPTMIFFKGGKEVKRIQGAAPKRILKEAFDTALAS